METNETLNASKLNTQQIIDKLINGYCVSLTNETQKNEIKLRLREIKKNCTIVLPQLKNGL